MFYEHGKNDSNKVDFYTITFVKQCISVGVECVHI